MRTPKPRLLRTETLEARHLLSAGASSTSRLPTIPNGVERIVWKGQAAYAYAGQWIVSIDGLAGGPAQQLRAGQHLLRAAPAALEASLDRSLGRRGLFRMEAPRSATFAALNESLKAVPGFRYLEPDFLVQTDATQPDDSSFPALWDLNNTGQSGGTPDADIDAPEAWDLSTGSTAIVAGVIDSGVDYTHPDLAANIWTNPAETPGDHIDNDNNGFVDDVHGYDFVNNDGDPLDDNQHGTHVAGTIGGVGNNGQGITGVNWNVRIMALKFVGANGSGSISNAIAAINYATMMHQRGVNIKLTNRAPTSRAPASSATAPPRRRSTTPSGRIATTGCCSWQPRETSRGITMRIPFIPQASTSTTSFPLPPRTTATSWQRFRTAAPPRWTSARRA